MGRSDCMSNRNIRIAALYVKSKLGTCDALFEGLEFPSEEYASAEDYFLNEDEWTTAENFIKIFRRAKEILDEPHFYFNCGASCARLRSWGRFHFFVKVFSTPNDGFRRLPFFNRNFNDTKEIEVLVPPTFDKDFNKIRTLLKIVHHGEMDPHKDFIGDPYLRGILSSIPTLWGVPPAMARQLLYPYDPAVLLNEEPEFRPYELDVRYEGNLLTLRHPLHRNRAIVGERIYLQEQYIRGEGVYLGKYTRGTPDPEERHSPQEAILITETVKADDRILVRAGEIYKAPYFIMEVSYDRLSLRNRFAHLFRLNGKRIDQERGLIETIDQLRRSSKAKNEAYRVLEKTNQALLEAKARLDDYAGELERMVEERTRSLRETQEELMRLNRDLETKVKSQVLQLEKYNELRRYLSPTIAEKVMTTGRDLSTVSHRKMMTVVFTDIRGFSALTDSLEPEEISHLLNRYLSEMIQVVHEHDGTLNKILGDGVMVFFGDPLPMEDHALRAVLMAVDMQKRIGNLREEWLQFGHGLGVGIGINTGFMTVGNIGSETYRDYTVIGNQVNIAARLEKLAGPGQIILSQRTYSQVKEKVEVEEVGPVQVKGIHSPIKTYNVKIF